MKTKIEYSFSARLWKHDKGTWYFVSVPFAISNEIRNELRFQEEGWGRMKIQAQIQELKWETSIWFDTKHDCYLLPIKAEIRYKLKLNEEDNLKVKIMV